MKLSDIKDFNKEDVLSALGLASKATTTERILSTLGLFGAGVLIGAGAALLLAPKSGADLREDLGQRFRKIRSERMNGEDESDSLDADSSRLSRDDEART